MNWLNQLGVYAGSGRVVYNEVRGKSCDTSIQAGESKKENGALGSYPCQDKMTIERTLPRVNLSLTPPDFHYLKRMIRSQQKTKAQRRVTKALGEAQERFFKDKARQERERLENEREYPTNRVALIMLKNARSYIMRTRKAFWYDKVAIETTVVLARLTKEVRRGKDESIRDPNRIR